MNRPPAPGVVRIALWVYVPMIASAVFVRAPGTLSGADPLALAEGLAAAAAMAAAVVLGSRHAARRTQWGRRLHAEFSALLGPQDSPRILLLSLLSAFGEEVLFRGVLQPRVGLWAAAALFAALHFPVRRTLLPWTAFAFVLGVVLGALTAWSGSLWPAIALHFGVNYFNLHDLAAAPPAPPQDPPPQT